MKDGHKGETERQRMRKKMPRQMLNEKSPGPQQLGICPDAPTFQVSKPHMLMC